MGRSSFRLPNAQEYQGNATCGQGLRATHLVNVSIQRTRASAHSKRTVELHIGFPPASHSAKRLQRTNFSRGHWNKWVPNGYHYGDMINRWIGIVTAAGMIIAVSAVISRDILPRWFPDDAPPSEVHLLAPGESRMLQVGIYDDNGLNLGSSWTRSTRHSMGNIATVDTTTALHAIRLPHGASTPPVRIETSLTYRFDEAWVDEVSFRLLGLGIPVQLQGETMPTGEFACLWQVGSERGRFLLDARAPVALGDVIRPFDRLPNLYVGQSWEIDLLDPLSQIVPGMDRVGLSLEPVLMRVTRTETIVHQNQQVEVFVVEGGDHGAVAYVADDGRVLRQEVTLPLVGRLVLLDEPYDSEALHAARGHRGRSYFGEPEDASTFETEDAPSGD